MGVGVGVGVVSGMDAVLVCPCIRQVKWFSLQRISRFTLRWGRGA